MQSDKIKNCVPLVLTKVKEGARWRQLANVTVVAVAAILGVACAGDVDNTSGAGRIGYVEGFLGGISADEPRAVLIGRDILSAGGTAADAASAVAMGLAVTYPSSAGLGGGGVCLTHDRESGEVWTLDFLPRAPKTSRESAIGVPGMVRGIYALQSRYGRLPWAQVVAPAESLARFGVQVSRAFAQDLDRIGPALTANVGMGRVFVTPDGHTLGEGDFMTQLELATTLGLVRMRGAGAFYTGPFAAQFVQDAQSLGAQITASDLRDYLPRWQTPIEFQLRGGFAFIDKKQSLYVAPPATAAGGIVAAQTLAMLRENGSFAGADATLRAHLLAETSARAFQDREQGYLKGTQSVQPQTLLSRAHIETLAQGINEARHQPVAQTGGMNAPRSENPFATGLVVIDRDGNAVACSLTMNRLFGTGQIAGATGIILAASPGADQQGYSALAPMMVVNTEVKEMYFAAAGAGGAPGIGAVAGVASRVLLGQETLESALAAPRVFHGGTPDLLYHEPELRADVRENLLARGHRVGATPVLGRVNAVSCTEGLPVKPESCSILSDPRGFGLAAGSME